MFVPLDFSINNQLRFKSIVFHQKSRKLFTAHGKARTSEIRNKGQKLYWLSLTVTVNMSCSKKYLHKKP